MRRRYKDAKLQTTYEVMRQLFRKGGVYPAPEALFVPGKQRGEFVRRTGSLLRSAFWQGFDELKGGVVEGVPGSHHRAAYMAGRDERAAKRRRCELGPQVNKCKRVGSYVCRSCLRNVCNNHSTSKLMVGYGPATCSSCRMEMVNRERALRAGR